MLAVCFSYCPYKATYAQGDLNIAAYAQNKMIEINLVGALEPRPGSACLDPAGMR